MHGCHFLPTVEMQRAESSGHTAVQGCTQRWGQAVSGDPHAGVESRSGAEPLGAEQPSPAVTSNSYEVGPSGCCCLGLNFPIPVGFPFATISRDPHPAIGTADPLVCRKEPALRIAAHKRQQQLLLQIHLRAVCPQRHQGFVNEQWKDGGSL